MTSEHLMTFKQMNTGQRTAGVLAISGAVMMFIGTAVWRSTGIDLRQSLAQGEVASYLGAAGSVKLQFAINTSIP